MGKSRKQIVIVPILVAILSLLMIGLAVVYHWLGPTKEGVMLFCEQARAGFVKQPSNTFSNFGFIFTGIYIGWISYKNQFSEKNRMTATLFYPSFFAGVVVFLGPGSMALHATNAHWGGFIDLSSMFLLSSFVCSYGAMRWFKLSQKSFLILFFGNLILCCWAYLSPYNTKLPGLDLSNYLFALYLLLGTVFELLNRYVQHVKIKAYLGWICLFIFLLAFLIWGLSRTQDSWFCTPESLIQGHAIWHLLCALATYFLFLFYASEQDQSFDIVEK